MLALLIISFFLLGLFIGSFLNVLVDRMPSEESSLKGRSHCDSCKHVLSLIDLIPIISFVMLQGKCRYCGHAMGLYYPLVELITGLLFAFSAYFVLGGSTGAPVNSLHILSFFLLYYLFLISTLIIIFFTDLKFGIIPFNAVALGLSAVVLRQVLLPTPGIMFFNYILSAVGLFLFFLFIFLVTRGKGMGFGDVVYAFLMGFILGYPKVVLGFYIAVISGAVIPLVILGIKHKKIRGATIPFGPFLVAGTLISLFWGDLLVGKALVYLHM